MKSAPRPLPRSIALLLVTIALAAVVTTARAEPFRPTDPNLVLLRVTPTAGRDADRAGAWSASPAPSAGATEFAAALTEAAAHIEEGRRFGQPRGFGRAEAMLEAVRATGARSAEWHVLSADIHQYRHEYIRALALLDNAVRIDATHVRAHLMRAAIRQTRGELRAARADCAAILGVGEQLLGGACLAQILGLTGNLDRAYGLLERQLSAAGDRATPAVRTWILGALADMAERRGDTARAELHLRRALEVDPHDAYARLALADLLIEGGNSSAALLVLDGQPHSSATLLRRAEAHRALGSPAGDAQATTIARALRASLEDSRRRGEQVDWRDGARLARLEGRKCDALRAADRNWQVQREPIDARLLATTAAECGERAALEPLLRWRKLARYQDAQLDGLLRRWHSDVAVGT